jgi:hypothetical protein
MRTLATAASLLSGLLLVGCAADEPSAFDPFAEEGKGDTPIGGIGEHTFAAFGVLNAAASLDELAWIARIGVSEDQAAALVEAQTSGGFGTTGLPTLKALARAGDLTDADIMKLHHVAVEDDLVPTTSIRIPVMDDDGNFLFKRNGEMREADLPFFRKFMFLWEGDAGIAQYVYFDGLDDQAQEAGIDVELSTGSGIDAGGGHGTICYVGDAQGVVGGIESGTSTVWTEMLIIDAWKAGETTEVIEDVTEEELLEAMDEDDQKAWADFDPKGSEVMIVSTASDSGDDPGIDLVDRCRN